MMMIRWYDGIVASSGQLHVYLRQIPRNNSKDAA